MKHLLVIAIISMAMLSTGCETVPTGHVGVVDSFGKVTGDVVPEGLNFMAPWKDVTDMSIQQINMDFKAGDGNYGQIKAPAKDKTTVICDATVIAYLNAQEPSVQSNAALVRTFGTIT